MFNNRHESVVLPNMILTVDDILVARPTWSREEALVVIHEVAQRMSDSFDTMWTHNLDESLIGVENGN